MSCDPSLFLLDEFLGKFQQFINIVWMNEKFRSHLIEI